MADNQSDNEIRNSNTTLLQKLSTAVDGHAATATFACGGSVRVPILDISKGTLGPGAQNLVPSVVIRWDTSNSYAPQFKIAFPLLDHDEASRRMFNQLLYQCDPATFGVGGRDILDEEYRKAVKLDASNFSTSFHPHDCGILDSVQQILLPSTIRGGQGIGIGPQGVRAELYKLNIYSGPSGKFRSHVDTPRGEMQFGSLVVCLPCKHEGGVLRVKHRGETVDFAWGNTSQQSIQWAAFYGDCEHEVLEVTEGHRITLTYNLYYSSIGNLAQPVSDPHHLPLFDIAREMLLQPQFMRRGGILGFYCHHQYAHSQQSGRKSIPGAFKGVDLAIFSVFSALGLKVGVHPIVQNKSERMGGLSAKELLRGPTVPREGDFVENCLENLSPSPRPRESRYDESTGVLYEEDPDEYDEFLDEREDFSTIVGTELHGPTFDENYIEEDEEPVSDAWPHQKVPRIIWMNECMHKDFALAKLAYGNEATLTCTFSAAAILVVVPPSAKRITTFASRSHNKQATTTTATAAFSSSSSSSSNTGADIATTGQGVKNAGSENHVVWESLDVSGTGSVSVVGGRVWE